MDVKKQLNIALETGKVALGSNKTVDSLLYGEPKLVIMSSNCPRKQTESITYYCALAKVKCVSVKETSIELGSGCGRLHPLSVVAVLDEGESSILEVKE